MSGTKQKSKPSLVGYLLSIPFRLIGWILLAWLIAILVFFVSTAFQGSQKVYATSHALLNKEFFHLNNQANFFTNKPILNEGLKDIRKIGLAVKIFTNPRKAEYDSEKNIFKKMILILYRIFIIYVGILINVTQLVLVRLIQINIFIPLFILLTVTSLVAGIVERYLRRVNGGRESALIYHYAKMSIKSILLWGCIIYIARPFYIEPAYLMVPCLLASSMGIYLTVKMFKKYS